MHHQLLLLLVLLFATVSGSTATFDHPDPARRSNAPPSRRIVSACAHARYPALCVRTLTPSCPRTPTDIAIASVTATVSSVREAISSIRRLPSRSGPLRDCLQQLSDSADQLSRTRDELGSLRSETSRMQLDNACTWTSAALTNEDTCLDGMKGSEDRGTTDVVGRKVRDVEKLTSNALYFVARLASSSSSSSSSGGRRKDNP